MNWVSPALPAPATRPEAGIIGIAEERFGLRKSPTAPMRCASPMAGGLGQLTGVVRMSDFLGQKRRASQVIGLVSGEESDLSLRTKHSPTHIRG